ncbi:bifunctional acetate--CoA ligase family protein/GNAT family N-acetyltransferase [soil metagenome]
MKTDPVLEEAPVPTRRPARSRLDHHITVQAVPPLDRLFSPRAIAVIGATEKQGSVGRTVLENLLGGGFGGAIHAVNPKRDRVLGVRSYASILEVPAPVDLAVIVTPASTVPAIIEECSLAQVSAAIIISAGFRECGEAGRELERQVAARRGTMRIIGPNCLGLMIPRTGLNATFASAMARKGSVGFISQSGALGTAILDWSRRENVGFSTFISIGSMLDVNWGDLIYHLGDDPHTRSIVIYMESIGDARAFLSAAREVALTKPIIVIKVGRTAAAARAAASHTGSLTGSDEVLDAAFRRAGVLRVNSIAELFSMAEVLGKQPRPRGPRLAIVTNGGGPGALATDVLIAEGGDIARLSSESFDALNRILPQHWSRGNPVDILGDASPATYAEAVDIVSRDPDNDGVLVILTPQAMTDATATAEGLKPLVHLGHKPILTSWMGGETVAEGETILNEAGFPTFNYPDTAARAFCSMWRYSRNLEALYETPSLDDDLANGGINHAEIRSILEAALAENRTLLTEVESKDILAACDIPVVESHVAHTAEEAVAVAARLGYPVVLKVYSHTVTHKAAIGGVRLDLRNSHEVAYAFHSIKARVSKKASHRDFLGVTVQPMVTQPGLELIIGCSTDAQFGPVLLFGAGGSQVETMQDRSLGLPPLNVTLARRMMEKTRIYSALRQVCAPADLAAIEQLLVRFSRLVASHPRIREIDINPLLVSSGAMLALDARVVLHERTLLDRNLPRTVIRPYPSQYVATCTLRDGTALTLRPIRPEDEPRMIAFHQSLSDESVHYRYFNAYKLESRVAHERLTRICFNDYDREIALVAVHSRPDGMAEIIGVGRLSKLHGVAEAEFALIVSDAHQHKGLGTELLRQLVKIARREKLIRLVGHILPDNKSMQHICSHAGFKLELDHELGEWRAEYPLQAP